jgi:SAM-dependent methyltransferase
MQDQKHRLSEIYARHHERGGRYGYLFCHGARGPYLKHWIGTDKRVLDLGCRDGQLTEFFLSGNQVIGADIDPQALDRIRKRLGIEAHWIDLNAEWPFEPNSFDAIVACEILEHIFFLQPVLDRICRSLKQGGLFIGSVPNSFRIRNRWKFLFGEEFDKDPTHVRLFSYSKIEKMISGRFQDLEIVPIQGKILPCVPVSPALPKMFTRLFAKDLLWRATKQIT